ncbi:hypothetical protein [Natronorarus salvus]|uniref:hypothetical protein n=1 Tax=Natronorarus salvus TaxID=3117733 RepID=UPI002F26863C
MTERHESDGTADGPEGRSLSRGDPVIDREDEDPSDGIVILTPEATIADWEIRVGDEQRTIAETNPEYDPREPVVLVTYEHWLGEAWPGWEAAAPHDLFDGVCDRGVKFYSFPASRLAVDPTRTPHGERGSGEEPGRIGPDGTGDERSSDPEREGEAIPRRGDDENDRSGEPAEAGPVNDEDAVVDGDQAPAEEEPTPGGHTWDPPEWILDLEARLAESASVSIDAEDEVLLIETLGERYAVDAAGDIDGDGALRTRLEPVVEELSEGE